MIGTYPRRFLGLKKNNSNIGKITVRRSTLMLPRSAFDTDPNITSRSWCDFVSINSIYDSGPYMFQNTRSMGRLLIWDQMTLNINIQDSPNQQSWTYQQRPVPPRPSALAQRPRKTNQVKTNLKFTTHLNKHTCHLDLLDHVVNPSSCCSRHHGLLVSCQRHGAAQHKSANLFWLTYWNVLINIKTSPLSQFNPNTSSVLSLSYKQTNQRHLRSRGSFRTRFSEHRFTFSMRSFFLDFEINSARDLSTMYDRTSRWCTILNDEKQTWLSYLSREDFFLKKTSSPWKNVMLQKIQQR